MSVVSNENKEMLWELIIDICNDNSFKVNGEELKQFLDGRCGYYHGQRFEFSNYNLNDINKEIIGQCYNFILSKQQKTQQQTASVLKEPINKRDMFDKNLAVKQKAFEEGINIKKPKEIDFSDGSKDFPMDNLGVIMNQTLADRQKELEQITSSFSKSQQEEATKWLNNGETPKIKIGGNVSMENEIIKPQKKVRFDIKESEEKSSVTNFFSKLKMKKNNNDIIEKLDEIISNQEKILKLLEKREEDEKDVIPVYEAI